MLDALLVHRLHFAFTITYHYLFPQLTMGLALLIVILNTGGVGDGNASHYAPSGALLGSHFRHQFRHGRCRHPASGPAGIPVPPKFNGRSSRVPPAE